MKPSKTTLTINIGITGHRDIDITQKPHVSEICKNILEFISKCTLEYYNHSNGLYSDRLPKLHVITSIAEGFDRIAAYAALDCNYEIQCPLPFSRNDYLEDFETTESKNDYLYLLDNATSVYEIDLGRSCKDKAYLNAGVLMLDHSDILITFWDGKPARGEGGTGDIVRLAKEKQIPIIHIDRNMSVSCNNNLNWKPSIRKFLKGLILPSEDYYSKK